MVCSHTLWIVIFKKLTQASVTEALNQVPFPFAVVCKSSLYICKATFVSYCKVRPAAVA
jgi:hypothetical protein